LLNYNIMNLFQRGSCLAFLLVVCCFPALLSGQPYGIAPIGQNFTGISYGSSITDSSALPPDANGAVGPTAYVEFINGIFAIYNKTNGADLIRFSTDVDFWANAGVTNLDSSFEVTDPRIIYDPASQRWFASQIDVDVYTQILGGVLSTNDFLLAVSATSDPNGKWYGKLFPSDPVDGNFADFPTLGVDAQGVYLSGDMFDSTADPNTAPPLGCELVSFPKSDLLKVPPVFTNSTFFPTMSYSQRGQVLQPAICSDGGSTGTILAAGDIGITSAPHSNLVTWAVQNASTPSATLSASTFISVPPYMVPNNADVMSPLFVPTQPDGTTNLMANDARFSAKVYSVGGVLYAVHNTELNNRIAIRWYRIRAADGALLEVGTIADTNLDLFYPSIAANPQGTVVIGCNGCSGSPNKFVSAYAYIGRPASGVTTFGSPILLKSGVVNYHGDDEGLVNPDCRWGDYSTTSLDPADPNRFWTLQMFAADTNVWSTQITEIITQPPVAIQLSGTNAIISWSSGFTGFRLLSATNLAPATWSPVSQLPVTNATQISVVVPVAGTRKFFRLSDP
jgi:hypothetical protein